MRTVKRSRGSSSAIHVRGFFRVKLGESAKGKKVVVGDSGWCENIVVNLGFQDYICNLMGNLAGSKQISYIGIGTGTAPDAADTSLNGETGTRKTTSNSVISSKTLQCTASWASSDHPGGTPSIQNLGLFNTSSGGTMCAGNTFAASAWNSNQAVSATYQLRFATA